MKQTILSLVACMLFTISVHAQHCSIDSIVIPVVPASGPGLTPLSQDLPCIVTGSPVSDTVYFQNFDYAYLGSTAIYVDSLKIDSINNLPAGLCWVSDRTDNTYPNSGNGVIYLEGTCTAAPGQYKMSIIVDAWTNFGYFPNSNAEALAGLRYYIRVRCPGDTCTALDSVNGVNYSFIPYTACAGPPSAVITPSGYDTICPGDSVTLSVVAVSGYTYRWSDAGHSTTSSIRVGASGPYTVTVYNGPDSAISAPTVVVIGSNPGAGLTLTGTDTFCRGDSAIISAPAGGGYAYLWSNSATSRSITVSSTGSYTVTVTNGNGCTAVSTPEPVTVNPLPTDTITQSGLVLTSQPASSYQWYRNGGEILGETGQALTVTQNGTYLVAVTANGCQNVSNIITVTGVGINELTDDLAVRLYPNPNEGILTLDAPGRIGDYYEVTDEIGRMIQRKTILSESSLVDVGAQPSGIYYLKVGNETVRFVIIK